MDAELALTGYVMLRKDTRERSGGGVILFIKESIQTYEVTLRSKADCEEAIWCNTVTKNSTLTVGVVYRSPHIGQEEDRLEPTRGGNVLDLILSSQNEIVDEPLGSIDHNQIHFNIKAKTRNTHKKQWRRNFNKGKYKEMRTYQAKRDWNNLLKNKKKQETECWTYLKDEIEGITEIFVLVRKQGKGPVRNTCQKRILVKIPNKQMYGYITH